MNFTRHALVNRECSHVNKDLIEKICTALRVTLEHISAHQFNRSVDLIIDNRFITDITNMDLQISHKHRIDRAVIRWQYHCIDEFGNPQLGGVDTFSISIGLQKNPVITCSGNDLRMISNLVSSAQTELENQEICNYL